MRKALWLDGPQDAHRAAARMADLGAQPHIIEAVLNHQSGHRAGVAGTYNRSVYAREVKTALALWSDHVRSLVDGGDRRVLASRQGLDDRGSGPLSSL
jgi:hypothetical protein